MYQLFPAEVKTKGMFIPAFLLCRGMTRWGEYADLHQIDEMAETPQDIVVTSPLPGCVFHPNLLPVFNYTPSPDLLLLLLWCLPQPREVLCCVSFPLTPLPFRVSPQPSTWRKIIQKQIWLLFPPNVDCQMFYARVSAQLWRPGCLWDHHAASHEAEERRAGGRVQPVSLHERRLIGQEEEGEGQVSSTEGERKTASLLHQWTLLQL